MGTISLASITNGTTADATSVDNNFTTISAVINGNIEAANIKSATITTAKVAAEVWIAWVPTFGGYSANPTISVARYFQLGKTVFCDFDFNSGTSNATTLTFTLPVAAKSIMTLGFVTSTDNGSALATPGRVVSAAGSTTVQVFLNAANATWTASGIKGCTGSFFYEAN